MNSDASHSPSPEVRRLIIMWGVCCMSPIIYLAAAAIVRSGLMNGNGFFPMRPDVWKNALIALGVWMIMLQVMHLVVKHRYKKRLGESAPDAAAYLQQLTRRTMILITLSELAVFAGFCLFICQGDITPVFGGGIGAMLLYAQSHPRSANPVG